MGTTLETKTIPRFSEVELPEGWVLATVRDVLDVNYGKGLTESQRDMNGKHPVYGSNGIVGYHSIPLTTGPCLIIGRKGAAGAVHYSEVPCWAIDTTYFASAHDGISLEYAYYALTWLNLGALDKSTAVPSLSRDDIYAQTVPIAPLAEQHRIVAKIEELFTQLDAGVAALKRVQASQKRYKAAVLKSACEGKLVPQDPNDEPASQLLERILVERRARWEAEQRAKGKDPKKVRYEGPAPVDAEGLAELPQGWVWTGFEQLLLELKNGYFSGTPATEPPGIPILRINAVRPLSVSFVAPRYLPEREMDKAAHYQLRNGDLLFTRYNGSLELVGACGMVRGLNSSMLYPDKLIRARVSSDNLLPAYLELYFATAMPRRIIENKVKSTAGQQGIAGADLKSIPVAIPPLSEQRRIVTEIERRLSVVHALEATLEANLKRAERLRQAILRQAFEGKLVPQDPSDEPAGVLLERIKAQKEHQMGTTTRPPNGKREPTYVVAEASEPYGSLVQTTLPLDSC